MRYILFFTGAFLLLAGLKAYEVRVEISGLSKSEIYLAEYDRGKTYIIDTSRLDQLGYGLFKKKERIPEGIYYLVFPTKQSLEFLIGSDQNVKISTNYLNLERNYKISGNVESEMYHRYRKMVADHERMIRNLRMNYFAQKNGNPEEVREKEKILFMVLKDSVDYFISQTADSSFLNLYIQSEQEIELPDWMNREQMKDSLFFIQSIYYKRRHFFDSFDLSDQRTLRIPAFSYKLSTFFTDISTNNYDTIVWYADDILQQQHIDPEVFKYVLTDLLGKFDPETYPEYEPVYLHLAEKYYLSGKCDWVTEEQLELLYDKIVWLKRITYGKNLPDVKLAQNCGFHTASDQDISLRIILFLQKDCSYCQNELNNIDKYKNRLSTVYEIVVYSKDDLQLNSFPVCKISDNYNLRKELNITIMPYYIVLDQTGKILFKSHTFKNVVGYLVKANT